jgi:hypothetical protein
LKNLKGRDHSEDVGVDGKIIFEWFLAEGRNKWQALVNAVMNVWDSWKFRNLLTR